MTSCVAELQTGQKTRKNKTKKNRQFLLATSKWGDIPDFLFCKHMTDNLPFSFLATFHNGKDYIFARRMDLTFSIFWEYLKMVKLCAFCFFRNVRLRKAISNILTVQIFTTTWFLSIAAPSDTYLFKLHIRKQNVQNVRSCFKTECHTKHHKSHGGLVV